MSGTTNDGGSAKGDSTASMTEPVSGAPGDLVEILPGLVAVYGEVDPEDLDGVQVLDVDVAGVSRLADHASEAVSGVNLLVQGAYSVVNARGLVRLAPETIQALRTSQPVARGGWNLGTLVSGGGRFAHFRPLASRDRRAGGRGPGRTRACCGAPRD